jgi:2-oxoglutarate dehydrogenase E2 component (dihydrolipoamide succinyltransferase)
MTVEIKVPRLAESISEATLVEWLQPDGHAVRTDQPVATLETDKAAVEIVADAAGVLRHARRPGETVQVGDILGHIEEGAVPSAPAPAAAAPPAPAAPPAAAPAAVVAMPAARRVLEERGIDPATVTGTGRGARILKEDAERAATPALAPRPAAPPAAASVEAGSEGERVEPMNRIRLRIAERLVQAQQTAAILTTFNEIDMSRVMDARARWKDAFETRHGVRLGFMSFFARACVLALHDVPAVNAFIRDNAIVFHDHVHLGIATATPRGLVVPVVRHAERLDFAGIEGAIAALAQKGRDGTLTPQELSGGTFTITNGGVFGSLLSTPILNPPQSGILGMHKIEKRPVVVEDAVVVRPMMYVALSYDHRLVDGEQAVTFLVRVKERLEDPERLLLVV